MLYDYGPEASGASIPVRYVTGYGPCRWRHCGFRSVPLFFPGSKHSYPNKKTDRIRRFRLSDCIPGPENTGREWPSTGWHSIYPGIPRAIRSFRCPGGWSVRPGLRNPDYWSILWPGRLFFSVLPKADRFFCHKYRFSVPRGFAWSLCRNPRPNGYPFRESVFLKLRYGCAQLLLHKL